MKTILSTACYCSSVVLFWVMWMLIAATVPYYAGSIIHGYRGNSHRRRVNWRSAGKRGFLAIGAYIACYELAQAAVSLQTSERANDIAYFFTATLGALPDFAFIMFATWYGRVSFIVPTCGALILYGIVSRIIIRDVPRAINDRISMAFSGCVATSAAFVLSNWLPNGGSFSIVDVPDRGIYVSVTVLAFIMASGGLSGYLATRCGSALTDGLPFLNIVGGIAGLVAGGLYHAVMVMQIPTYTPIIVVSVRAAGFIAPCISAVFVSRYISAVVAYHRAGYPGPPLGWFPRLI